MSKFNNPNAFNSAIATQPPLVLSPAVEPAAPVAAAEARVPAVAHSSALQRLGLVLLSTYILSMYANDLGFRFFHTKTPLSLITEFSLPFVLLICGTPFRALRTSAGKMWVIFMAWLLLDIPFSVWRTGSIMALLDYGVKAWPQLLYIGAFVVTIASLRRFMYVQIASAMLLLVFCYAFGQVAGVDRFDVEGSVFFSNANELAMRILFGVAAMMLVIIRGKLVVRVLAVGVIAVSVMYVLKTGSRAGFLGGIALFLFVAIASKHRVPIIALGVLTSILGFLTISDATRQRLALAFSEKTIYEAKTPEEISAIESRMQRQQLLQQSIQEAFTHPLFGVGPAQFAVAVSGDAEKKGRHAAWLGTHNSYTQVACECGFPAFICYMGVLVFSFRTNYRLLKVTRGSEKYKDMYALSFSLMGFLVVYAVCTFFDHIAYSELLAMLGGCSITLKLLAQEAGVIPQTA